MGGVQVLFLILAGIAAAGYAWYVSLITRRNRVREAMGGIDVQLRMRFDLLPNVLELAQKFMTHEKALLTSLTSLRSMVNAPYDKDDPAAAGAHLEASRALDAGIGRLFAVAENYPELRSAETITRAQATYEEVESNIAAARRFYNASVTALNNAVEVFPGSVIAQWANVSTFPFYEITDAVAREPVRVSDHMK
ncbi:MAG: LemA family protein [Parvibaculum sp.]|nr:LemA family protein [Parvibaculum sp.]